MMLTILISTLMTSLAGILAFIYYLKQGQFDECEDVKYQLFRDEERREG